MKICDFLRLWPHLKGREVALVYGLGEGRPLVVTLEELITPRLKRALYYPKLRGGGRLAVKYIQEVKGGDPTDALPPQVGEVVHLSDGVHYYYVRADRFSPELLRVILSMGRHRRSQENETVLKNERLMGRSKLTLTRYFEKWLLSEKKQEARTKKREAFFGPGARP